MGANKVSNFQKCADFLVNTKTMKNKTKVFTFRCTFCSADCDNLKKISKHLEEKHLNVFDKDPIEYVGEEFSKTPNLMFEPDEIKVEIDMVERYNDSILSASKCFNDFEDPIGSIKSEINTEPNNYDPESEKNGHIITKVNYDVEDDTKYIAFTNTTDEGIAEDFKNIRESLIKEYTSENSDDSRNTDYNIERELNRSKSSKNSSKKDKSKTQAHKRVPKKESVLNSNGNNNNNTKCNNNESNMANILKRKRRPIYTNILPFLIQQYKKHEILWQVDNIAFGVTNKKYEVYSKIAEEIKLAYDKNITPEDAQFHINFLNQIYSKDKEQEIKCNLKQLNFVPEYKLYTEMSFLNHSQGPFLCQICNEILPRYDPYCQHMAQHTGNPPFKCPSCSLTFNKYCKYLIHKKRHLGILNFHCDICGKGYLFKNDLEWHVTSHTGEKPFLCQVCGKGFRSRHGYDNHIRRHEERFRYECHICKRGFNFLYALNFHVKAHLKIRDVICKICGKGFTEPRFLRRHELLHGDKKTYKCSICGKAFFQDCGLRAHRKKYHS